MDPSQLRIEIFAPFGEAFELTKKILFQPFDLAKWFVIGFAAWLATFFSGGGFNYNRGWGNHDWNWHWKSDYVGPRFNLQHAAPWVVPVIVAGALFFLAFLALLLWLNSRGRFMFTDCIVRNRGAIAEPWREYRVEGNRYFIFQIVISLCSMLIFGGLVVIYFLGSYLGHTIVPLALIILFGVGFALVALLVALIMKLAVPVMYRQRCTAVDAFLAIWQLILASPGVFILFGLFYLVILVAAAMIGCLAACVTCCIAVLPYIGTVILLPVVMVLYAFPLCFLRQFGDPYDVWAVVRPAESLPPPTAPPIPPVQETPPPV
ncbi:MAG: DUF7544 domain-containing protein [Chthoniobacterales bacterium]